MNLPAKAVVFLPRLFGLSNSSIMQKVAEEFSGDPGADPDLGITSFDFVKMPAALMQQN